MSTSSRQMERTIEGLLTGQQEVTPLGQSVAAPTGAETDRMTAHSASSDPLWESLYGQLKSLAQARLSTESNPDVLQATALLNEAYLRMAGLKIQWRSRSHFLAMAARVMRRILVDHARARRSQKRGDGRLQVTLSSALQSAPDLAADVLDVNGALTELASHDQRKADIIELFYFAGASYSEIAAALIISQATVKRDLRTARAWLLTRLQP